MKKAVYAGSFDPITNGHLWMIRQGVNLFDELVVAVGSNPDKHYTFSTEIRVRMIRAALSSLPHIVVDSFADQFLVHYANSIGAQYILRGIRTEGDYEYERGMRHINSDLCPEVGTVFLMPPREIAEVSSSMIKGLIGPEGWEVIVRKYVPEAVYQVLLEKFAGEV
ncbi:MAG: pantetheine-phosphate adenylyltransferase [Anaerolineae bacterium]|nr:pantetheine-phosphate adenylyltransferase [Anaerolineae bacterium]